MKITRRRGSVDVVASREDCVKTRVKTCTPYSIICNEDAPCNIRPLLSRQKSYIFCLLRSVLLRSLSLFLSLDGRLLPLPWCVLLCFCVQCVVFNMFVLCCCGWTGCAVCWSLCCVGCAIIPDPVQPRIPMAVLRPTYAPQRRRQDLVRSTPEYSVSCWAGSHFGDCGNCMEHRQSAIFALSHHVTPCHTLSRRKCCSL